jgi:type II secretory pathway pseudopilin PulG
MEEAGYVLLGITILLVIMGIFMGAAVPLWQHVVKREKEEELIWRGKQYVQAIELYQRKHPGAYPPNLKILVEQKYLRKLYEDPMVEDGEWRILRQLSPEVRRLFRAGGTTPGAARQGGQPSPPSPTRSGPSSPRGGEQGLGGIVGVVSKSEEESIRILDGTEHYNEWLFVYAAQAQGTRAPGVKPPGAPQPPGAQQPPGRRPQNQQPRSQRPN